MTPQELIPSPIIKPCTVGILLYTAFFVSVRVVLCIIGHRYQVKNWNFGGTGKILVHK